MSGSTGGSDRADDRMKDRMNDRTGDRAPRPSRDVRLASAVDALLSRLATCSGFAPEALSRERLMSHLAERASALGAGNAWEFVERAPSDPDEYARVEALFSPPETWLFRYPESFELLRARAATRSSAPFRAFLAGCGGWCEPISVAAALLDGAATSGRAVEVRASDRNAALFAAEPAFRGLAIRGGVPAWASPHFTTSDGVLAPDARVREVVRARVAGVLEAAESALASGERYDAVVFRNVAIYLDADVRRRAFRALSSLVAPDGVLLVGHAETTAAAEATGFVAVDAPGAFALAPPEGAQVPSRTLPGGRSTGPTSRSPAPASVPALPPPLPPPLPQPRPPTARRDTPMRAPDERVMPHADAAARTSAQRSPDDAATVGDFVARALASEAAGELADAERAIGRALYLDRAHEEALLIAARLATARGAPDEADRLRARAMRAHLARESGGVERARPEDRRAGGEGEGRR